MNFNPEKWDGYSLDVIALATKREEFEAVWNHRQPVSKERTNELFYHLVERGKVDVLQFLFDADIVDVSRLRRSALPHMFTELAKIATGEATVRLLLEKGLDIESPLSEAGHTLLQVLTFNDVPDHIAFAKRFLC